MIGGMSDCVRRRRVGRPALPYTPVQMNLRVHPSVRRFLHTEAERRGLNANTLLMEIVADAMGTTVADLTAAGLQEEEDTQIQRSA